MTIREYISDKLKAFGISEAQFVDIALVSGVNPDTDIMNYTRQAVADVLISTLEESILAPKMNNINEAGFSATWDFDKVGQYYLWLCKKWSRTPDADIVSMLGISIISDKSNMW